MKEKVRQGKSSEQWWHSFGVFKCLSQEMQIRRSKEKLIHRLYTVNCKIKSRREERNRENERETEIERDNSQIERKTDT